MEKLCFLVDGVFIKVDFFVRESYHLLSDAIKQSRTTKHNFNTAMLDRAVRLRSWLCCNNYKKYPYIQINIKNKVPKIFLKKT